MLLGGPKFTRLKTLKKLSSELDTNHFIPTTAAKSSFLEQRQVEIVKRGTPKCVAPERAQPSAVRTSASRHVDGDEKERAICRATAKIVFSNRAPGGERRRADLVRSIRLSGSEARLLDSREHCERRAARKRGDIEQLPARGHLSQGMQRGNAVEGKVLDEAGREDVSKLERGRSFVQAGLAPILRRRLQHRTGSGAGSPAEYAAGVIEWLTELVTDPEPQAEP